MARHPGFEPNLRSSDVATSTRPSYSVASFVPARANHRAASAAFRPCSSPSAAAAQAADVAVDPARGGGNRNDESALLLLSARSRIDARRTSPSRMPRSTSTPLSEAEADVPRAECANRNTSSSPSAREEEEEDSPSNATNGSSRTGINPHVEFPPSDRGTSVMTTLHSRPRSSSSSSSSQT